MLPEEAMTEEKKTEPVEQPVLTKKDAPADELADTIDQFLTSTQAAGMKSLKSMLAQFSKKADAALSRLDEAAGGAPPKDIPEKKA